MVPNTHLIHSDQLELRDDKRKLIFKSPNQPEPIEIDQFIVQLHQNDILELSEDILCSLVNNAKLLNDFRTIFIGHDKRFLAILSRDDVLSNQFIILNEVYNHWYK